MKGRIGDAVQTSATVVRVVDQVPTRRVIIFSASADVFLKDQDIDATGTNGFFLQAGTVLRLEGEIAGHRFTAVRATADGVLGFIEGYPDAKDG